MVKAPDIGNQKGFIRLILLIIIIAIVLGYFGIDIRGVIEHPTVQQNLQYAGEVLSHIWENYLRDPVLYFWHNIFIGLVWETLIPAAAEQVDNANGAATST